VETERKLRKSRLKSNLIDVIHAHSGHDPVDQVVELLTLLRDEVREANDKATVRSFLRNQGEIRGYTRVIDGIVNGNKLKIG
jgi:hypothetical protein